MNAPVSPESFTPRARRKLRLVLLGTFFLQLLAVAAVCAMLARPFVAELAAFSPWLYTAVVCGSMLGMTVLVGLYGRIYYAAVDEVKRSRPPESR